MLRLTSTTEHLAVAGVNSAVPSSGDEDTCDDVRHVNTALQTDQRIRTAFVLSGGGARGAMQAGAMRALLQYGERPDAVIGTSSGAWNAAWVARSPTLSGVRALEAAWRALRPTRTLLGRRLTRCCPRWAQNMLLKLTAGCRLLSGAASVYDNAGISECLHHSFAGQTFESLALPLRIVATDLTHARAAVLQRGLIAPAVLASCAIPGLFPPVRIGDSLYADGALVDNCSVETAQQMGARRIFVLAIGYDTELDGGSHWSPAAEPAVRCAAGANTPSAGAVVGRSTQVMSRIRLQRELEQVPSDVEVHVIPLSTPGGAGCLDFAHISDWIELGYRITHDYLLAHVPAYAPAA